MRPILLAFSSVNQRDLPSGPAVMPKGPQPAEDPQVVGRGNSVILPAGVMRPILFPLPFNSVNQRLPSGPAVMPRSPQPKEEDPQVVGRGSSVILPAGVMRPILFPKSSVNHRLPSGPAVMP